LNSIELLGSLEHEITIISLIRYMACYTCMKTSSTSGVISVSGGTQLGCVIVSLYLNGYSSHAGLTIGMSDCTGMAECTGMSECTGMTS
jgi:hypothetical protein